MTPLGEDGPRGDETLAGESGFGDAILGGEGARFGLMTAGGEYVRGDPSICGDLSPVGDAFPGNGITDNPGG